MSRRKVILTWNFLVRVRLSWVRIRESRPISRKVTSWPTPLRSSPEVSSTAWMIRGISLSRRGTWETGSAATGGDRVSEGKAAAGWTAGAETWACPGSIQCRLRSKG